MKKYILGVLLASTLFIRSGLCGDSKYERLRADIHSQNLLQLKTDLRDNEHLSQELYAVLIDEARQIHANLAKELSLFDYLMLYGGGLLSSILLAMAVESFDTYNRKVGEHSLFLNVQITQDAQDEALGNMFITGILGCWCAYIAKRGYDLTHGSFARAVGNADSIVWALEKAKDFYSDL